MEFTILKDILIIFALSTLVNFIFTKIKIPSIVGYLLTGVLAGPHLTGVISSVENIEVLAEIGVVLLLFTIGLEFSLKHLIKIRKIVFWGGFLQFSLTTLIVLGISRMYNLDFRGALFVGFLTALSSTAVVLKILQDRSEITSNYGRTVLGVLIFQDLILVPLLLFTPIIGGESTNIMEEILWMGLKSLGIILFVIFGNKWFMNKLLHAIAMTKNQELFLMSILLICLSVAFLTAELGMSLAFGAFLAGLMISESEYSHNAFGHIIPFKDTFSSFFFVSIGMLLDLQFLMDNITIVLGTVAMVVLVKMFIASGTAFMLGHTFRGVVLVGLALAQVGEFSFILVKLGQNYQIISEYYYQLFLAVAVITMSISPFLIMVARPLSHAAMKLPLPKRFVEGLFPLKQIEIPELQNHLILIGKDSRALSMSVMARHVKIPYISIVFDPATVKERQQKGESVIYGDAQNSPILEKAHVKTSAVIVISVGDVVTAMSITEKVRHLNRHAAIIVRTRQIDDAEDLYRMGATQVLPEEFETAIEMFERVLNKFLMPRDEIEVTIGSIRKNNYGLVRDLKKRPRRSILSQLPNLEVSALRVADHSPVADHTLSEMEFRGTYGVTVVAVKRKEKLIDHPGPNTKIHKDDIVYILGKQDQIAHAVSLFEKQKRKKEEKIM
ncbi:cation:proton antiporter domain-containing protein [Marinilabilia rubra]|uniref:Sodium:proton exchanger n=1 Tax=Marinilabilia rubra TaxID=2162893 RepID=A0A2U2B9W3_9BACT|nr:cation:proton antiporter [Marinilabilia rubra]PWD99826.1 sodium:proton exchanger [Marinilabilia rubra]